MNCGNHLSGSCNTVFGCRFASFAPREGCARATELGATVATDAVAIASSAPRDAVATRFSGPRDEVEDVFPFARDTCYIVEQKQI